MATASCGRAYRRIEGPRGNCRSFDPTFSEESTMGARLRKRAHDLQRDDRRYLGRAGDADDLQITAADGSRVTDARGRTFIDFQMGWCVGNLGWNHPAIVER